MTIEEFMKSGVIFPELCARTSAVCGFPITIYEVSFPDEPVVYQVMRWDDEPGPGLAFAEDYLWTQEQLHPTPEDACRAFLGAWQAWQIGDTGSRTWIYFIQDAVTRSIKIGSANQPALRLAQLQVGNGSPLLLLATMSGTRTDESRLHHRFKRYRLRGEWFRPAPELLQFIDNLLSEVS